MDKKPNFALLIGSPKKDAPPTDDTNHADDLGVQDEGESQDMDQSSAETSAVKDLISAFNSKDVEGVKAALKDFIELCYPQSDDSESDSSDSGNSY